MQREYNKFLVRKRLKMVLLTTNLKTTEQL